ncbi:MAG: DUF2071 domain-containing protein [Euryarchaeota archaeon]|nr:DUF2071 domain-containing protein [Euryarchaeota archaeon]MBT5594647.1 DUF2071 domain-containing protein [Euryarchaeota archaeon]MBT5843694.1 DUF2071 domain-containing protein [Euryarchaeota archaeon]MBT6641287.1 DUF2071 domain-containing protein [Euryarchaeota archaeon]MBT6844869.1 DUF2071 domain-containing protein [Euryarchaeota archaeon]
MSASHNLDCKHIPFPMPHRKCTLYQNWKHLTFMHWKVDIEQLKTYIPEGLEIDLYNGDAYVGVIPFIMEKVRPRGLPWLPFISTFGEFNIRTYVKKDDVPGVLFLTLDAQSMVTCFHAPRSYGLPYRYAKAKVKIGKDGKYTWFSRRKKGGESLIGTTNSSGQLEQARDGSIEYFLFERYSLYTWHEGSLHRAYTHHEPWKYCVAEVQVETNTLLESYNLGISSPLKPEYIHMSTGVQVQTWNIQPVEGN